MLPYYNASNPTQAWHGPNNSGAAQGTVRSGKCIVKAKADIAATAGTQTTLGPDSGYIGAFEVTVTAGQTELTSASITMASGTSFLPAGGLVSGIPSGQMTYARDYGTVNACAADFTPPVTSLTDGMRLTFLTSGSNTRASTFSLNGLPAAPVYSNTSTALTGGTILASAQIEVIWNSTLSAWVLANTNLSALSKGFVRTVNDHAPDEHGNVQLGTAADADIVTSMTDTTAGRVPVVGWEGLGGYALQTTDAELQSPDRLPTRFFIQGNGDADKRFGHFGSGVHIEYGTGGDGVELSANMFVRADGNIIVEWLQVNADGLVNLQNRQMLYGPLNKPAPADCNAVSADGGDYNATFAFGGVGTIGQEQNPAKLFCQQGNDGTIVSGAEFNWYNDKK
ncbi:hypothetical protein [Enterobacter ludwigii]|uniref:hypothetical protein n=1 Tax=Enterobacter ludwigii TaxID=299767 RepID=UPI003F6F3BCD